MNIVGIVRTRWIPMYIVHCKIENSLVEMFLVQIKIAIFKENTVFSGGKRKRSDSILWQKPLHPQNNSYTTIADRPRTVSWSDSSHPTGVVKPVYERSTFPLTATAV